MLWVDFLLPRPGELRNLPHLWLRTGGAGRNGKRVLKVLLVEAWWPSRRLLVKA